MNVAWKLCGCLFRSGLQFVLWGVYEIIWSKRQIRKYEVDFDKLMHVDVDLGYGNNT